MYLFRGSRDDGVLSRSEYTELMCAGDAFVLATRAEGFCRPCAEAMAWGTPAIVTGWGGHRHFMTANNSVLLDFTLAPVESDILQS